MASLADLPRDILLLIMNLLTRESHSLSITCKSFNHTFQETHEAAISRSANKWLEDLKAQDFETSRYFKKQSNLMIWTCAAQQREQPNEELQKLMNTLRITKKRYSHPMNEEGFEIDYQRNLHVHFQFGKNEIVKISYWGYDDEGCNTNWQLRWHAYDLPIFQGGMYVSVAEMKNMKHLHDHLGLSSSLMDFTKFLRDCLPIDLSLNLAFVKRWPRYDMLNPQDNPKIEGLPLRPPKKQKREESTPLYDSFDRLLSSFGQPLAEHWVDWFYCKVNCIYWTRAIRSEWKDPSQVKELDETMSQMLEIAKTYNVEHEHKDEQISRFTFQVNNKTCRFQFKKISTRFDDTKGKLSWISQDNNKHKIVEVRSELVFTDKCKELHQEWNVKFNLKQFGMFLVLCLPVRLYDYDGTQGGLNYSARRMDELFEVESEDSKIFKKLQKYLEAEGEEKQ